MHVVPDMTSIVQARICCPSLRATEMNVSLLLSVKAHGWYMRKVVIKASILSTRQS